MARSFRDVIEKWDHKSAFATDVGVPYERAKAWWRRDRIPAAYFVAISDAARRRGHLDVTEQTLSAIAARAPQPLERVAA